MKKYETGIFHPSLNMELTWYRCHPAFGALPFRLEYGLDDCLDSLSDGSWNALSEESQEKLVQDYCSKLLEWFTSTHASDIYFSGAYELKDKLKFDIPDNFTDKWDNKYLELVDEVDVHELALVSGSARIVIYESWDNIFVSLGEKNVPSIFSNSWVK